MTNNDGDPAFREEIQMNDIGLMVAGIVGLITYLIMNDPVVGILAGIIAYGATTTLVGREKRDDD